MAYTPSDFDFESWRQLAQDDPEAFEARRRAEFERVIEQAPAHLQPRLRGLQWRLDMARRRHTHPLGACVDAFQEMWNMVYGPQGLLSALRGLADREAEPTSGAEHATVVQFRARAGS